MQERIPQETVKIQIREKIRQETAKIRIQEKIPQETAKIQIQEKIQPEIPEIPMQEKIRQEIILQKLNRRKDHPLEMGKKKGNNDILAVSIPWHWLGDFFFNMMQ